MLKFCENGKSFSFISISDQTFHSSSCFQQKYVKMISQQFTLSSLIIKLKGKQHNKERCMHYCSLLDSLADKGTVAKNDKHNARQQQTHSSGKRRNDDEDKKILLQVATQWRTLRRLNDTRFNGESFVRAVPSPSLWIFNRGRFIFTLCERCQFRLRISV